MVLADGERDGFADFPTDWIVQGIFKEGLAQDFVGRFREEAFFELALLVGFLLILACLIDERDDEALVGQQLRGDIAARVDHRGVDEVTVLDAIQ